MRGALLAALICTACGGNPSAPSDAVNLSGTWRGVLQAATVSVPVTFQLESGASATHGSWESDANGLTVHGPVALMTSDGAVSGSLGWTESLTNGLLCVGGVSLSGDATARAVTLRGTRVEFVAPSGEIARCEGDIGPFTVTLTK